MKQTPLKHYRAPEYPELNRENEASVKLLLKKRMPARWKRLAASAAVLCASAGLAEKSAPEAAGMVMVDAKPEKKTAAQEKGVVTVAPLSPEIFKHARGVFGCVAVSAPVFLSEDEAATIIFDELGKAGIRLKPKLRLTRKPSENPVEPEETDWDIFVEKELAFANPSVQKEPLSLELDWFDAEKGVAVEFMGAFTDVLFWNTVASLRENPSAMPENLSPLSFRFDYGKSALAFAEVVPTFEGERPWKVALFTPSFLTLTAEEGAMISSFYDAYHKALAKAVPRPPTWSGDAMEAYSRKRDAFDEANKKLLDEIDARRYAYLKLIGKSGEPELRAQVRHFVKWLEEQGK